MALQRSTAATSAGDAQVLVLSGELDHSLCAELRESALDALAGGAGGLILDLTAVSFLDSAAVTCLATLQRRSDDMSVPMLVVAGEGPGAALLYKSGNVSTFSVKGTLAEATEAVRAAIGR